MVPAHRTVIFCWIQQKNYLCVLSVCGENYFLSITPSAEQEIEDGEK